MLLGAEFFGNPKLMFNYDHELMGIHQLQVEGVLHHLFELDYQTIKA